MRIKTKATKRGVALVIALSFITLLSGVVLLWCSFSKTNFLLSRIYSNQFLTSEMEKASIDQVLAELSLEAREIQKQKRGIADGSIISNGAVTQSDTYSISPAKWGWGESSDRNASINPVLLRRSSSSLANQGVAQGYTGLSATFYSTFAKASTEKTDISAPHSNSISSEKWQLPHLLNSGTDFTEEQMPEWIYLNSQAVPEEALQSDSKARFAYLAYDMSGLIDVNVCGTPKGFDLGYKGRSFCPDFSLIPKVSNGEKIIDQIVQWRMEPQKEPKEFGKWLYGPSISSSTPFESFLNTTDSGNLYQGVRERTLSNNAFLSRSDLLDFLKHHDAMDLSSYVRNNSPEILRPELMTLNKTAFLNQSKKSIDYYKLDGTKDTYSIESGDPCFQRKFPLARLEWFNQREEDGKPKTPYSTAIQKHFGLKWDETNKRFMYVSPEGSAITPTTKIKSLSEIKQLDREPDFFEWLKEAIKPESLGQTSGYGRAYTTNNNNTGVGVRYGADFSKDFHIIQIGCNIIDQWDSDDLPTTVETKFTDLVKPAPPQGFSSNNYASPNQNIAFGIENLPYLNEIIFGIHRTDTPPVSFIAQTLIRTEAWMQYELWNPHQSPSSVIHGYGGTTVMSGKIKILEGEVQLEMSARYGNGNQATNSGQQAFAPISIAVPASDRVFSLVTSNSFSEPALLGYGVGSTYANSPDNQKEVKIAERTALEPAIFQVPGEGRDNSGSRYLFSTPNRARFRNTMSLAFGSATNAGFTAKPMTLELGIEINGNWFPYQRYEQISHANHSGMQNVATSPNVAFITQAYAFLSIVDQVFDQELRANNENVTITNPGGVYQTLQDNVGVVSSNFWNNPWTRGRAKTSYLRADPRGTRFGFLNTQATPNIRGNLLPALPSPYTDLDAVATPGKSIRTGTVWNRLGGNSPQNGSWQIATSWSRWYSCGGVYGIYGTGSQGATKSGANYWSGSISTDQNTLSPSNSYSFLLPVDLLRNHRDTRSFSTGFGGAYYKDYDGTLRPADYAFLEDEKFPTIPGQTSARPVILNRPFRSVAELGYVFRDLPGKSLDFFSPSSADLGLLDVFCLEEGEMSCGRVNLLSTSLDVKKAILGKTYMNPANTQTSLIDEEISKKISSEFEEKISAMTGASDLAKQMLTVLPSMTQSLNSKSVFAKNKIEAESVMRSLLDAHSSTTWNVMFDIVTQTGKQIKNSEDFSMSSERRAWVHASVDRLTGRVIDLQIEHPSK